MYDIILKNGKVINAFSETICDVAITDGKIVAIGSNLKNGEEIIDIEGKFLLPGAIDVHTHLEMPFGGTISADSYSSGTKAASCGGVTTVFDFIIQKKNFGLMNSIKERYNLCKPQAHVDYSFHVAITDASESVLNEFEQATEFGITSYKIFMVYKKAGLMVDDGTFIDVLNKAKAVGSLVAVHAENSDIIDKRIEKYLKEGKTSPWYHYKSREEFIEAEADKRAIYLAKSVNAPLYIVHLANKDGVEAVREAKRNGQKVYAETCPQYLKFTNEVYKKEDGQNFVCSPAIKGIESQKELWKGINDGTISVVATDHCPFQSYEKNWGKDDFTKIPNGCMGIENLYPYMLSNANNGILDFSKVIELCSYNPAKIFGCKNKGEISIGKDADLVVYDPNKQFIVSKDNMHSNVDYTIWEGTKMNGYIDMTFLRGKRIYNNGNFLGKEGDGKFIKCEKLGYK